MQSSPSTYAVVLAGLAGCGRFGFELEATPVADSANDATTDTAMPAGPETSATVNTPPIVHRLPAGPAQSMVGFLDDVVIWQRALSASEVRAWDDASRR